jgi:predicted amidophosphoribosyltransferase
VFDFLLPLSCLHCHRPSRLSLCEKCLAPFRDVPQCVSYIDGVPLWVTAYYAGSIRRAIVAYKEEGIASLRKPLSFAIANGLAHFSQEYENLVVVPIPSRIQAIRSRGEDVIHQLALAACQASGVARPRVLLHMRPQAADQGSLNAAARRRNMTGALELAVPRGALPGGSVVLVDDVVTTGETVRAAIALFPPEKVVGVVAVALVKSPVKTPVKDRSSLLGRTDIAGSAVTRRRLGPPPSPTM